MKYIDNFLNGITMYKLVLYGLFILAGISIIFGFLGLLPFSGLSLIISFFTLTVSCWATNTIFAKIFKVQVNVESYSITALILYLVTFPIESLSDFKLLVLVGFIAMASKYILAIRKKHIFNPVAVPLVILGFFGFAVGAWWVGNSVMLLPTLVLGFLVLRKLRRFEMFFCYMFASVLVTVMYGYKIESNILEILSQHFLSGPILFLGAIMLTEPQTTPFKKKYQIVYGIIAGGLHITPELAIIVANAFSYLVNPDDRRVLKLSSKDSINKKGDVDEFRFESNKKLEYKAGQYLEWTLGHDKPDSRGNRRYFTISSSPTEKEIKLGIKYYDDCSSFKLKLGQLETGEKIYTGSLAGEFTLPDDKAKKLVFIAGGIGVTPFRSMAKYMTDTAEKRDVVLMYSNKTPSDVAYKNIFDEAEQKIGFKTLYFVNELEGGSLEANMRLGRIDPEIIKKEIPDHKERMFYISGPHGMVTAFQDSLSKLGIPSGSIRTDFFPGFV